MKLSKIFIRLFCMLLLTQRVYTVTAFQSMAKDITQQLLNMIQYTQFERDSHFQQLLHSTLSQLQNTDKVSDIDATIDIIISNLSQRKTDDKEVGISFMLIVTSHMLRIAAQRLYVITSYIQRNAHYWKYVDQQSIISYCLSHFPTVWGEKIGNHHAIKQKILTTEKLYTVFVSDLGKIVRLIHTMPEKIDINLTTEWINDAITAFSTLFGEKKKEHTQSKNETHANHDTIAFLKHIKQILAHFEQNSKNSIGTIKTAISQPSLPKREFGKIIATAATILGFGAFFYYKATSIKSWYEHAFSFAHENIWDPIIKFAKNIVSPEEGYGTLLPKEKIEKLLADFEQTKKDLDQQILLVELTEEEKINTKLRLATLIPGKPKNITEDTLSLTDAIVTHKDFQSALNIIRDRALQERTAYGSTSVYVSNLDIVISLLLAQLFSTRYKGDKDVTITLSEVLNAIARFDRESATTRKLLLLTPAVLSLFALYKSAATIYTYITHKDYHVLQKSLKELETATICSIDQPDNNENYGMFIFILESLKQGVVQTVSSRYTDKQELLRDLARLESPELTFEQRYKLIAQMKQEHSIFQK